MAHHCIACNVPTRQLQVEGYLISPPVFFHDCERTRKRLFTTDGIFWSVNKLPKEVKFRATNVPAARKAAQRLAARAFGLAYAAGKEQEGSEGCRGIP